MIPMRDWQRWMITTAVGAALVLSGPTAWSRIVEAPIYRELDNGMRFAVRPGEGDGLTFRFVVNSVPERDIVEDGVIAHLLEHLAFRRLRGIEGEISELLMARGLSPSAGFQGMVGDQTVLRLRFPNYSEKNLVLALDLARRWLDGIEIDQNIVEREKITIAQESGFDPADTEADDADRGFSSTLTRLYEPKERSYREKLLNLSTDAVIDRYRRWYRPGNAGLIVEGDVPASAVAQAIERQFAGVPVDGPRINLSEAQARRHISLTGAKRTLFLRSEKRRTATIGIFYPAPERAQGTAIVPYFNAAIENRLTKIRRSYGVFNRTELAAALDPDFAWVGSGAISLNLKVQASSRADLMTGLHSLMANVANIVHNGISQEEYEAVAAATNPGDSPFDPMSWLGGESARVGSDDSPPKSLVFSSREMVNKAIAEAVDLDGKPILVGFVADSLWSEVTSEEVEGTIRSALKDRQLPHLPASSQTDRVDRKFRKALRRLFVLDNDLTEAVQPKNFSVSQAETDEFCLGLQSTAPGSGSLSEKWENDYIIGLINEGGFGGLSKFEVAELKVRHNVSLEIANRRGHPVILGCGSPEKADFVANLVTLAALFPRQDPIAAADWNIRYRDYGLGRSREESRQATIDILRAGAFPVLGEPARTDVSSAEAFREFAQAFGPRRVAVSIVGEAPNAVKLRLYSQFGCYALCRLYEVKTQPDHRMDNIADERSFVLRITGPALPGKFTSADYETAAKTIFSSIHRELRTVRGWVYRDFVMLRFTRATDGQISYEILIYVTCPSNLVQAARQIAVAALKQAGAQRVEEQANAYRSSTPLTITGPRRGARDIVDNDLLRFTTGEFLVSPTELPGKFDAERVKELIQRWGDLTPIEIVVPST